MVGWGEVGGGGAAVVAQIRKRKFEMLFMKFDFGHFYQNIYFPFFEKNYFSRNYFLEYFN